MPIIDSITIWWLRPMPRHSRPPLRRVHGQRLLGEHHRVARVRRHDARADLDPWHLAPDDGERGERVVAEDLRRPDVSNPSASACAGLGDHVVDAALVDRVLLKIPVRMGADRSSGRPGPAGRQASATRSSQPGLK